MQLQQKTDDIPWKLFSLPAFPTVAMRALQLLSNENTRLLELYHLVESDPGLSTEVLRIANSPLYPHAAPIKSLTQAAMLLGFDKLRGAAVAISIRSYLGDLINVPSLRACWHHSLACAVIAEELANLTHLRSDDAFTGGIIHDIGRIALATIHSKSYATFLGEAFEHPCDAIQAEKELFGVDHCQLGLLLMTHWNLPGELIEITARHHDDQPGPMIDTPSLVRLACGLADALGFAAIRPLEPRTCEQLMERLPETSRHSLHFDWVAIAESIKSKIRSMESA